MTFDTQPEETIDPVLDEVTTAPGELVSEPAPSEAERQRDEYFDTIQRLQADFENYRKRVARQNDEASLRTSVDLVTKLLPVLDALDLAQIHVVGASTINVESLEAQALIQVRSLLVDTLTREGLTRVEDAMAAFDPHVHDAVAFVEGDGPQVVDEILRTGYLWKGSVVRPAMVRVRG